MMKALSITLAAGLGSLLVLACLPHALFIPKVPANYDPAFSDQNSANYKNWYADLEMVCKNTFSDTQVFEDKDRGRKMIWLAGQWHIASPEMSIDRMCAQ